MEEETNMEGRLGAGVEDDKKGGMGNQMEKGFGANMEGSAGKLDIRTAIRMRAKAVPKCWIGARLERGESAWLENHKEAKNWGARSARMEGRQSGRMEESDETHLGAHQGGRVEGNSGARLEGDPSALLEGDPGAGVEGSTGCRLEANVRATMGKKEA